MNKVQVLIVIQYICCSVPKDLGTPRNSQKCGVFQLCIVSPAYRQVLFFDEIAVKL